MKIDLISIFPEYFAPLKLSLIGKAEQDGLLSIQIHDLRDFTSDVHRTVDDTPYGGGDGMLLMPGPLFAAIEDTKKYDPKAKVILMTPKGERWRQSTAQNWADGDNGYIFVCGRYEGYDERILTLIDQQVSVGDYVLTGGELPAMTIIDSVVRLIPGVLGGENSAVIESFSDGETLEYPQYTRPEVFNGVHVPEVLLSGNHSEIAKWRSKNSHKSK